MFVQSGKYKRRRLVYPKSLDLRPTKQIVKEALFNILQDKVQDSRFLDLCCGSGAVGIEALSRGASHCVFVDKNVDYLNKNLEWVTDDYTVFRRRCYQYFKHCQDTFDIIFLTLHGMI